jgi:hypothetical protein
MTGNGGASRRTGRRWLWIIAGIAGAGAIAAVVAIWHLPDRMYPPGSDGAAEARAALQGGLLTAAAPGQGTVSRSALSHFRLCHILGGDGALGPASKSKVVEIDQLEVGRLV